MGEIAEMMLDGTLCQQCGEFIGDAVGYPRSCRGCAGRPAPSARRNPAKRMRCPGCDRRFATTDALNQHMRDAHHHAKG